MSGRRQQDSFLTIPRTSMKICNLCKADLSIVRSLESYEYKNGLIKTLCSSCATENWLKIRRQDV
jgi:hypothetical protein